MKFCQNEMKINDFLQKINEILHFLKFSWILIKNIPSWSKFSQEFDGINEKSPNPQLRG